MPKYKEITIKVKISQEALLGAQPPREPKPLQNPIAAIIAALNEQPQPEKDVKPDG